MIRVQEIRYRDDALWFSCMSCLVYENVAEMIARKLRRDQPWQRKSKASSIMTANLGDDGWGRGGGGACGVGLRGDRLVLFSFDKYLSSLSSMLRKHDIMLVPTFLQ